MLINLRNAMMAGRRLPYDAEVEYLQSSGTQYIDTGVVADSDTQIVIGMSLQQISAATVSFGAAGMQINIGKNFSRQYFGTTTDAFSHNDIVTDVRFDLDMDAPMKRVVLNGTAKTINWTTAWTCADAFPLFAFVSGGQTYRSCRVYSCKIWQNGVLVRDFIPVRKGAVGYLYDRVSGKLFGNAGSGDFVLGPDVVPVEYIESHGTEWIDTGLVATANNSFGAEVGFETTVIDHGGTGTTNTVCICGANGTAGSGFELRWQYLDETIIPTGGSYGNYVTTHLTKNVMLSKFIVAKNMNGHITYDADGTNIVDITATVADVGFVTGSVLLFGVRRGTSVQGITLLWAKMKYAKFYYANNIAESLIPVRVGSGSTWEGAMMDVLTRRIYRNAGTGAFGYGNDLKYPIPA